MALAEADLVETHSGADKYGERAGADFGIERAVVARRNSVELGPAICDRACQKVEPTRRAFGIRDGLNVLVQIKAFHERNHIDAALFQHGTIAQINLVHLEFVEAFGHRASVTRKKRGAHAPCARAKAQVKRGGLHLFIGHRQGGIDRPTVDHLADRTIGQNTHVIPHPYRARCVTAHIVAFMSINAKTPASLVAYGRFCGISGRASRT